MSISHATSLSQSPSSDLVSGQKTLKNNTTDVYFTFTLSVRITNLWVAPYSTYQQFLYDRICGFRQKGWNYQQIADWFNSNDYTTTRGHKFFNSSCQSIVKKKHLRDARLSKTYPPKLSNFALKFVDKTLIDTQFDDGM